MSGQIFSFTPKKLLSAGISLGLLSVLLAIGLAAYLSIFNHIITHLKSYLLLGIPAILGCIAVCLWLRFYEVPEPVVRLQNDRPALLPEGKNVTPQDNTLQEEEKSVPQSVNDTQFIEPTYPQPANDTRFIGPAFTLPIYGSPDTIHLPPETFLLEQETHVTESSTAQQSHMPDIPTLKPITQSIPIFKVREFIYPKEGKKPENSQDKLAYYCEGNQCRFAVADGVGNSFLPDEWAQILTNNFVKRNEDFKHGEDFVPWLIACSRQWYTWVDEQWIPIVQQRLGRSIDWSRDRARGAQATFIGCSFDAAPLINHDPARVNVMTIGDSVLFHLQPPRPSQGQWRYNSYPGIRPEEFGPVPFTLATRSDLIEQAWQTAQIKRFDFEWGDIILLTTDALAKWIVTDVQRVPTLLTMRDKEAFGDFVLRERSEGTLELDDVTLLIIYLQ
ncbi:MAG: protein phosphatase 2C domain-containing protein [Ktedonobacteraceae bacterium]